MGIFSLNLLCIQTWENTNGSAGAENNFHLAVGKLFLVMKNPPSESHLFTGTTGEVFTVILPISLQETDFHHVWLKMLKLGRSL